MPLYDSQASYAYKYFHLILSYCSIIPNSISTQTNTKRTEESHYFKLKMSKNDGSGRVRTRPIASHREALKDAAVVMT